MATLLLHGRSVSSFFDLLGTKENDMTFGLGFVLARSPNLLRAVLNNFGVEHVDNGEYEIRLQGHGTEDRGFTDIEIHLEGTLILIIEAKVGWEIPGLSQLSKYAGRFKNASQAKVGIVSGCDERFVRASFAENYPFISWNEIYRLVRASYRTSTSIHQKYCLNEYESYLKGVLKVSNSTSNMVYCVSLSLDKINGSNISWLDVVQKHRKYFFPFGAKTWPKTAPAYMAFRSKGKLLSIHHVDKSEVCENHKDCVAELRSHKERVHLLHLGPAIIPPYPVPNGKTNYRSNRLWLELDTLLTCATIEEAVKISGERHSSRAA